MNFFMLKIQSILGSFWDLKLIIDFALNFCCHVPADLPCCLLCCWVHGSQDHCSQSQKEGRWCQKEGFFLQANLASQASNAKKFQFMKKGKHNYSAEFISLKHTKSDQETQKERMKCWSPLQWTKHVKDGPIARKWLKTPKLKRLLLNLDIWVVTGLKLQLFFTPTSIECDSSPLSFFFLSLESHFVRNIVLLGDTTVTWGFDPIAKEEGLNMKDPQEKKLLDLLQWVFPLPSRWQLGWDRAKTKSFEGSWRGSI